MYIIKKDNMVTKKTLTVLCGSVAIMLLAILLAFPYALALSPSGASTTAGTPESAPADAASSELAFAGNVTEVTISGYTTTQSWQGFFGNVSGTIQLADSSDNIFYNWTLASPEGEVYASTNDTLSWTDITCFNFTATGAYGAETAGETSLLGKNLSQLEAEFNIVSDDVDGLDETFAYTVSADQHDLFYTANLQFSSGECLFTLVFDNTGASADTFEEALLWEPTTGSVVFAAILEEADTTGFNGGSQDFQMLVLEDGHGTDVSTTTYYFWVELE